MFSPRSIAEHNINGATLLKLKPATLGMPANYKLLLQPNRAISNLALKGFSSTYMQLHVVATVSLHSSLRATSIVPGHAGVWPGDEANEVLPYTDRSSMYISQKALCSDSATQVFQVSCLDCNSHQYFCGVVPHHHGNCGSLEHIYSVCRLPPSLPASSSDALGITDAGDRVKLLQNITTMRADLVTTPSSSKLRRSPLRARRFSEAIIHKPTHRGDTPHTTRHSSVSARTFERGVSLSPTKMYRGAAGPNKLESPASSVDSSRMGSPVKLHPSSQPDSSRHFILETEGGLSNGLQTMVTLRDHRKKRLSRSIDGLMQVCLCVCACVCVHIYTCVCVSVGLPVFH